jgi:hypothetical protein
LRYCDVATRVFFFFFLRFIPFFLYRQFGENSQEIRKIVELLTLEKPKKITPPPPYPPFFWKKKKPLNRKFDEIFPEISEISRITYTRKKQNNSPPFFLGQKRKNI